jgi:hypothetical protein
MKLTIAAVLLASAALAACAEYYPPAPPPGPPPPPLAFGERLPPEACFRTADIRNHTIGDDRTLYVDVHGRGVYRIEMNGACLAGAVSSDPIILRQPPGSSLVCRPIDIDLSISRGGFATPCLVRGMVRLTPDEVAALPPKLRP